MVGGALCLFISKKTFWPMSRVNTFHRTFSSTSVPQERLPTAQTVTRLHTPPVLLITQNTLLALEVCIPITTYVAELAMSYVQ
jgi:hypothetical protein